MDVPFYPPQNHAISPIATEVEMKTFLKILCGCLLLLSASAAAMEIKPSHSGSWYNPDQPGHGLSVEVINAETLVIYWNTYHPDGTPMWLMSVAEIEGDTAVGEAFHYSGMPFGLFDPFQLTEQSWGVLSLTFVDCNSARFGYDSPLDHNGVPYGAGEIDLVRLTSIDGLNCLSLPPGKFGNFSSGLDLNPPMSGWPGNSFVWIHRDGTLAYQAVSDGEVQEIGYGHLTKTDGDSFEFEANIRFGFGQPVESFALRQGTGRFEDARVTLNLGELGALDEPLDPMTNDPITFDEIAGDYSGPDAIWFATVDESGKVTGFSIGGDYSGTLTIPEPGFNQLVDELQFAAGTSHGIGVYHRVSGFLLFIDSRDGQIWSMPWFR